MQLLVLLATTLLLSGCNRLTSYVNPLVGTDGHGHTYPGAILPHGMVQVSPDTRLDGWDGCSGYHYSDDTIYGFSHTHLSGTGCSDYGDLLIMPFTLEQWGYQTPDTLCRYDYCSPFSHKNEKAEPGYYRVLLDRNRVMAELSVFGRIAVHRYTYPYSGEKGVVIDLQHRDVVVNSSMEQKTVTLDNGDKLDVLVGCRQSAAWTPDQHFYFAIAANCKIEHIQYYLEGKRADDLQQLDGKDCKALVYFAADKREVELYVGISEVDEEGAIKNLAASLPINLKQAKKAAQQAWEAALGQIEVTGGTKEDRQNFYTALYHCMTSPYLYSDVDGRYRMMNPKSGVKGAEDNDGEQAEQQIGQLDDGEARYTVFSVWDTYRALHPLLNIIDPDRSRDFVNTFLDHYRQNGELTMWELSGWETHCMIGYHSASVILDAYRTGVLDGMSEEELNELLEAMTSTANLPILGRQDYARDGYLSSEYENESVSKTLEYAYDDWCIAQMAALLGEVAQEQHPELCLNYWYWTYDEYIRRSQSWKNILDDSHFMHARRNGGFVTPFNPTEVNNHFTEANSWQYSTYVPHDIEGLAQLHGGDAAFERFLDSLFNGGSATAGRQQADITGMIGQYAHGNEPSHHAAYLYAYIGKQYKSAALIRKICTELYHSKVNGDGTDEEHSTLCGNEDCGQMSAWYVMSALGFYPVCPGSGEYVIGSPLFSSATIHLKNGKDIVIKANGQSHDACYVKSLRLNGEPYDKSFITFEQLKDGCELTFTMSSTPDEQWASAEYARPHSSIAEKERITPAPRFGDWQQRFVGSKQVTLSGADSIYYTTDGSTPTCSSMRYTGPITVDNDITIKAIGYNAATGYSSVVTQRLTKLIQDRTLSYIIPPDPQYYENGETGLIDRLHGTENFRIGGWQGWQGDCEVVIDMLEDKAISHVGANCLESMRAWIFFPRRVEVTVSNDGSNYRPFGQVDNTIPATLDRQESNTVKEFEVRGEPTVARYVRVKVVNYGKLPDWHVSAGEQAWLFLDEITVR